MSWLLTYMDSSWLKKVYWTINYWWLNSSCPVLVNIANVAWVALVIWNKVQCKNHSVEQSVNKTIRLNCVDCTERAKQFICTRMTQKLKCVTWAMLLRTFQNWIPLKACHCHLRFTIWGHCINYIYPEAATSLPLN